MKKIIYGLISAILLIILILPPVFAVECIHDFQSTHFNATCIEPSYSLFTCKNCTYSFKKYDWEYTPTSDFQIVFESDKSDDAKTLTVKATIYNNPGLMGAKIKIGFNASALSVKAFTNGDVWARTDYMGGIHTENNPFSVYTEVREDKLNYNNGLYFTVEFNIIDSTKDYGISITSAKGDFASWDNVNNKIIVYQPDLINLIGKKEVGEHLYGAESIIKSPTFTEKGLSEKACTLCDNRLYEEIDVIKRFSKGDLDGDGKINTADCIQLKMVILGVSDNNSLSEKDAADVNSDSKINALDAIAIKSIILGIDE